MMPGLTAQKKGGSGETAHCCYLPYSGQAGLKTKNV